LARERTTSDVRARDGRAGARSATPPLASSTTDPTVPRDAMSAPIRIQSMVELRSTNQKKRYVA